MIYITTIVAMLVVKRQKYYNDDIRDVIIKTNKILPAKVSSQYSSVCTVQV